MNNSRFDGKNSFEEWQKENIFNAPLNEVLKSESNFNKNLYNLYLSNL